jgi:anti-sigma factor RsiW
MTLPCDDMKVLLNGHLDQELDAANAFHVEDHMRTCSACANEYQRLTQLRAMLCQDALRYPAPDRLRARILGAIEPALARPILPAPVRWWQRLSRGYRLGVPAVAFATGIAMIMVLPRQSLDLEQELVSEHVRSLMANHITDVTTSDQHTVKPWFDGRLDFAPPVIDLAGEGFALTGGRLDYIAGRAVAALVYKRREHIINVFIWPAEKDGIGAGRVQSSVNNGYNTLHWFGSGMTFWAISDLNPAELQEFTGRFQGHLAHP